MFLKSVAFHPNLQKRWWLDIAKLPVVFLPCFTIPLSVFLKSVAFHPKLQKRCWLGIAKLSAVFLPCCYRVLPCFAKTCCFTSKPAETLMTSLRKTVNHVLIVFLTCLAVFAASRPSLHIRRWVACVKLALPALVQVVLQLPVTKHQPSQDLDRSTGKQSL